MAPCTVHSPCHQCITMISLQSLDFYFILLILNVKQKHVGSRLSLFVKMLVFCVCIFYLHRPTIIHLRLISTIHKWRGVTWQFVLICFHSYYFWTAAVHVQEYWQHLMNRKLKRQYAIPVNIGQAKN